LLSCAFSTLRRPPSSPLFPYTTLFRSEHLRREVVRVGCVPAEVLSRRRDHLEHVRAGPEQRVLTEALDREGPQPSPVVERGRDAHEQGCKDHDEAEHGKGCSRQDRREVPPEGTWAAARAHEAQREREERNDRKGEQRG